MMHSTQSLDDFCKTKWMMERKRAKNNFHPFVFGTARLYFRAFFHSPLLFNVNSKLFKFNFRGCFFLSRACLPSRPFLLFIVLLSRKKNYLFIASGAISDEWIVGWIYCVHRITAKLIRESLSKRCNKTSRQADFTCDSVSFLLSFRHRRSHLRCRSPMAFNTHCFSLHLFFLYRKIAAHLCNIAAVSILYSDTWT